MAPVLDSTVATTASPADSNAFVAAHEAKSASTADRPYQRLANEIQALITNGTVCAEERLPSERMLAEQFAVSRTSIREAIIALEIRGVVEVRGGSGIYVRAIKPSSFSTEVSVGPFELLRGRLIVEPELCAVAATSAKDSDLDKIYLALDTMRNTLGDKRANEIADRSFHVAIAAATANDMLAQIVGGVWDRRQGPMWEKIEEHFHTPSLREAAMEDHQMIFNALAACDAVDAKEQMRKHILRVISEFGKAW